MIASEPSIRCVVIAIFKRDPSLFRDHEFGRRRHRRNGMQRRIQRVRPEHASQRLPEQRFARLADHRRKLLVRIQHVASAVDGDRTLLHPVDKRAVRPVSISEEHDLLAAYDDAVDLALMDRLQRALGVFARQRRVGLADQQRCVSISDGDRCRS